MKKFLKVGLIILTLSSLVAMPINAAKYDKKRPSDLYSKAIEHLDKNQYGKAQKVLRIYTRKKKDDADGWTLLAFSSRKLGSYANAEKYYENSFSYIYNSYPYDGSGLEKIYWSLSASAIDLAILQHEYPKETGHVVFSPSGWGTVADTSVRYGLSNNPEYIKFSGGPYAGSVYDSTTSRESSLKINPSKGNTLEFWLKKDSSVESSTQSEIIFDSHTSEFAEGNSRHGRFLLEYTGSSGSPFCLTYLSGGVGYNRLAIGQNITKASIEDGKWHHYAFVVYHADSKLTTEFYVDGKYNSTTADPLVPTIGSVEGYFVGTIGAMATTKGGHGGIGYGKLSGSLDEVRFWKVARSPQQINNHFDFPVNGATDKENIDSVLGLYYKFNEGTVSDVTTDKLVLDYSGRLNNGEFIGYNDNSRNSASAITFSSATDKTELGDPIINASSSKVVAALETLKNIAKPYDEYNNSSIFKMVPQWAYETRIGSSNLDSDFSILLQAMASKFDSIKLLIDGLPRLGFTKYQDFSFAKGSADYSSNFYSLLGCERDFIYNFNIQADSEGFSLQNLASRGLDLDELPIVNKTNLYEYFDNIRLGKSDPGSKLGFFTQESSAELIKNKILNSVYSNLSTIYQTKGTEAAFRNIIRCFGADEKLVAPNVYISNSEIIIKDDPIFEDSEIKSLSLVDENQDVTLFQTSSATTDRHYVEGKLSGSMTFESKLVFPDFLSTTSTFEETSLFGINEVATDAITPTNTNNASVVVTAIKSNLQNKGAYFEISSSTGMFTAVTSSYYPQVFDGTLWNVSARFSEDTGVKIANANNRATKSYKVELVGYQYELDQLIHSFSVSSSISHSNYHSFIAANKGVFIGAERENITGSVLKNCETRFVNFSVWDDYISDEELKGHAKSADNIGRLFAYQEEEDNQGRSRLKSDALALNWQFDAASISDNIVQIEDHKSGSLDDVSVFGPATGYKYPAKSTTLGDSTSAISTEALGFVKYVPIDNAVVKSRVEIKDREVDSFELDSRPYGYLYTYEKSMYQVISREMLKMLSGVSAYNNLIGEPIYKYRKNYKSLEKLRERFFRKIENEIDLEKFIEYYKWIDSSLGKMLKKLQPATTATKFGLEEVVESHVLERNKYKHQSPIFEFKDPKIVTNILGINELLYDWQHGHAPIAPTSATATIVVTDAGGVFNGDTFVLVEECS